MGLFITLLIIILLIYVLIYKQIDSQDKRFDEIVELSAKKNKKTTGEEFGIKPIKFKDELENVRYVDDNYEEKNNKRITITNHFINKDNTYKTYRVEIENYNGKALFYSKLLDSV